MRHVFLSLCVVFFICNNKFIGLLKLDSPNSPSYAPDVGFATNTAHYIQVQAGQYDATINIINEH